MEHHHDALYALLAASLGFVERGRLLQEWPAAEGIRARLLRRGLLTAVQAEELDRVAEARTARHGGNVEQALAASSSADASLLSQLAGAVEDEPPRSDTTRAIPAPERYVLGEELGRGGLGRVVSAWDSRLRREVAVKLVLDGLPPALLRRFEREAEITGRLEHPNIVPVHDFGPQVGGGRLGLCMKKVQGRDLRKLLGELSAGGEALGRKYSLARLLRIFQDICLAMAFAHDRGVVHRDLKPSNVMIGDFGETLVVDWGLAKEIGTEEVEPEGGASPAATAPGTTSRDTTRITNPPQAGNAMVTADGTLMGTPAYMAPEQAAGKHREVDARSDIYALGAILYEILTLRPPVRGDSVNEIVTNVLEGRLIPPSERVLAAGSQRGGDPARPIPPELEAICLRAMAFRKEDRFASAMDLHDDVQLFLEGAKQKERERQMAEACVRRARAALGRQKSLSAEASEVQAESERIFNGFKPHEDKSASWAAEDRARALRREAAEARAEVDRLVTEALGHDPELAEARGMRAEIAWENFLAAEKRGDGAEAVLQRGIVERYDDGSRRARLEGTGTLGVGVSAWLCACLSAGCEVAPGDWIQHGYHRLSGRLEGGRPESAGLPDLEPASPVRFRVHGPGCRLVPVAGARVWAWQYEERDRLVVPVTPKSHPGAKSGGGPAPVAAVFAADSPFRPVGPGVFLGRTPIERCPMPMGSWLLVVDADGFAPQRMPVEVRRCADVRQDVLLFRPGELHANDVPVAPGLFHFQGDSGNPYTISPRDPDLPVFAIARFPVTAREYAEFLNAVSEKDPSAARAAAPRAAPGAPPDWPGPPFHVPTTAWLAGASPEQRALAHRPGSDCAEDWHEDWPIVGVSWADAMRFAAWKRERDGVAWVLPTEEEWEKAARGVDGRGYVCGEYLDDRWSCLNRSFPDGPHPAPVGAFPQDESPYGVRGMAGNSQDHCVSVPGPGYQHWRLMRGGAWTATAWRARTSARVGDSPASIARHNGFRLARLIRVGGSEPAK